MRIIGGKFKGHLLKTPKGDKTRPTSSQLRGAVFNICQNSIEGADFLDLFCGSGAVGIEALSRGAKSATFVDQSYEAILAVKENLMKLSIEAAVYKLDALVALKKFVKDKKAFDLIFVDPPYGKGFGEEILIFIDQNPVLKPGGTLFIEEDHDLKIALRGLHEGSKRKFLYEFRA